MLPVTQSRTSPGRRGPLQFPPSLSERSAPLTPGSPSRLPSRVFTASMAFTLTLRARLSLFPLSRGSSRRGRLRLMLRTVRLLPLTGLSTLGFDTRRFPLMPPACYRASWQLPGPDSHRQATTSLRPVINHLTRSTSSLLDAQWNKIEHRLFSRITGNWRGRPLTTYQTVALLSSLCGPSCRGSCRSGPVYAPDEPCTDRRRTLRTC